MLSRLPALLLAGYLLALVPAALHAQVLRGRVIDAASGAPVAGSIVKAVNEDGAIGGGTLTNSEGAFTLTVPTGFPVASVVVERIGYDTHTFEPRLFADTDVVELSIDFSPVQLAGIVVTVESLCRVNTPGSGAVQTIWNEAKKSLQATELSQAERIVRYEIENFERRLAPANFAVLEGSASRRFVTSDNPYRSIPIEQMIRQGWVEGSFETGMRLFAPDAGVLLTEEFASHHCFRAEQAPEAVLLHFTPNRERRSFPELEGTLVLDQETAELTELRFRYVGAADLGAAGGAGGEVRFLAAPNGLRIVRDWSIRAPVATLDLSSLRMRVDHVHEEGGRVLAIEMDSASFRLPVGPLDLGVAARARERRAGGTVALTRPLNGTAGLELLVRNDGEMPYRVTGIRLTDCLNTAMACGAYPVDVLVQPGETAVVFRVRRFNIFDRFRVEWNYAGQFE